MHSYHISQTKRREAISEYHALMEKQNPKTIEDALVKDVFLNK